MVSHCSHRPSCPLEIATRETQIYPGFTSFLAAHFFISGVCLWMGICFGVIPDAASDVGSICQQRIRRVPELLWDAETYLWVGSLKILDFHRDGDRGRCPGGVSVACPL